MRGLLQMSRFSTNQKNTKHYSKKTFIVITVLVAVILFYVSGFSLLSFTIVNPIKVFGISFALAILSSFPLFLWFRNHSESRYLWISMIIFLIVACGFFFTTILSLNYFLSNNDSTIVKTKIEKIYSENRQKQRRVRNRYIASGETYKVYYILLDFPDGKTRKYPLSLEHYNKYISLSLHHRKKISTIDVTLTTGLFGWQTITKIHY